MTTAITAAMITLLPDVFAIFGESKRTVKQRSAEGTGGERFKIVPRRARQARAHSHSAASLPPKLMEIRPRRRRLRLLFHFSLLRSSRLSSPEKKGVSLNAK